jgi:uracil phosphoribosyltransferase
MLRTSDRGYIVLDDRHNRSMREFIRDAAASGNSCNRLSQLLVSGETKSNVSVVAVDSWHTGIPLSSLERILTELQEDRLIPAVLDCAKTSPAAAVLATRTRRSDIGGPMLQVVHTEVGRFLADRLMDAFSERLVVQDSFSHVQGNTFHGRVAAGASLLIVPLMRGGEPMSRGVYERFPCAKLFHFSSEQESREDLSHFFTSDTTTDVIIVDSVINEGRSVRSILHCLQGLVSDACSETDDASNNNRVRFYVLTAVMQKGASLQLPQEFPSVCFLTLRLSENKYKGRGGTDTGNRLFGTC